MTIRIGNDNVSTQQIAMLHRIKNLPRVYQLRELIGVISDPDISSGRESLLPEWKEIYQSAKDTGMPEERRDLFERIFPKINGIQKFH
jgi:hypothetical protein